MSYEGYEQYLCAKGHLRIVDCNMDDDSPCDCGEPMVWHNSVDTTNGSFDDEGDQIDGCVDLEVEEKHVCICSSCGNEHHMEPIQYKIPIIGRLLKSNTGDDAAAAW